MGDRKISIRTSVLEEKATACNMLCCYADELKDGFYPYVEQARPRPAPRTAPGTARGIEASQPVCGTGLRPGRLRPWRAANGGLQVTSPAPQGGSRSRGRRRGGPRQPGARPAARR